MKRERNKLEKKKLDAKLGLDANINMGEHRKN